MIVRRLNSLNEAVQRLPRDLDTLAVGLGGFVRYSSFSAPLAVDEKVSKRAEALYRDFLGKVGEQFRASVRFTLHMFPSRGPGAGAVSLSTAEGDGRRRTCFKPLRAAGG